MVGEIAQDERTVTMPSKVGLPSPSFSYPEGPIDRNYFKTQLKWENSEVVSATTRLNCSRWIATRDSREMYTNGIDHSYYYEEE